MTHEGKGGGISRKEGRGDGMGSLGEGVGEVGGACTRRWREKGDTEEAKWKFSAILKVKGRKG